MPKNYRLILAGLAALLALWLVPQLHQDFLFWVRHEYKTVGPGTEQEHQIAELWFFFSCVIVFGLAVLWKPITNDSVLWELSWLVPISILTWFKMSASIPTNDVVVKAILYLALFVSVLCSVRERPKHQLWLQALWLGTSFYLGGMYMIRCYWTAFLE